MLFDRFFSQAMPKLCQSLTTSMDDRRDKWSIFTTTPATTQPGDVIAKSHGSRRNSTRRKAIPQTLGKPAGQIHDFSKSQLGWLRWCLERLVGQEQQSEFLEWMETCLMTQKIVSIWLLQAWLHGETTDIRHKYPPEHSRIKSGAFVTTLVWSFWTEKEIYIFSDVKARPKFMYLYVRYKSMLMQMYVPVCMHMFVHLCENVRKIRICKNVST